MNRKFNKPMVAVATFAICVCLTGVTALALTGKLEGYFKDIKRWDGAITGTAYEQATEEIRIDVTSKSENLTVVVEMLEADKAPYMFLETLGIQEYKILNMDDKLIMEGEATEMAAISGSEVMLELSTAEIPSGDYKLVVTQLVGGKKADQPLVINGMWECEFTF